MEGEQVYIPGNPCTNGQECSVGADRGMCENGLCVISMTTSTTAIPNTTTTTLSPSTTSTTTTTTTTTTRRRSTDCPSRARNGEYPNENAPPASRMDLMVELAFR
ncbi:hypothetical protein KIN20_010596 [Parelaphostrongylus tenuis]|uniref:Uncharacterized protein n=1 Tax=Parelaphostrongylus tenuis TaxID=148309 RepID=A0AAD5M834_PARTN|nr:hypothetical protein KIN20_010596 [Parelaphostrongylus tenuis]